MLDLEEWFVRSVHAATPDGRSIEEVRKDLAREAIIDLLRWMDCHPYNDPQTKYLVEILRFAFKEGLL